MPAPAQPPAPTQKTGMVPAMFHMPKKEEKSKAHKVEACSSVVFGQPWHQPGTRVRATRLPDCAAS